MADQKNANTMLTDAKVRIVTKSDIRYEGKLYQINATEKTVALKDVKSFGSEDRCKDRFVPPSDVIYEYIVFRSVEIKDLVVLKDEVPDKKEKVEEAPKKAPEPAKKGKPEEEHKIKEAVKEAPRSEVIENKKEEKKHDYDEGDYAGHGYGQRDRRNQRNNQKPKFEFDEMIQKLDVIEKNKDENDVECKKYVGDDFFDDLSTSINKTDKRRDDPYQNRRVAKETFGYVPHQSYNRGGQGHGYHKYQGSYRPTRYQSDYKEEDDGQRGGNYRRRGNNHNFVKKQDYEYVKKEN